MPSDVKAVLSAVVLVVAAVLAYWSGSPIRPDYSTFVIVMAILMVVAMWIFPEAGVKKGDLRKVK
jgi:membrane protein YdbS with pleckstrin-like domain